MPLLVKMNEIRDNGSPAVSIPTPMQVSTPGHGGVTTTQTTVPLEDLEDDQGSDLLQGHLASEIHMNT